MKTELTIDQIELELAEMRALNRKMLKELLDARAENNRLTRKFQLDREWLAQKLEIISEGQSQGHREFAGPCSCGLTAVLEQAKKRASSTASASVDKMV